MHEEWWESPVCWLCDYWWALLLALVLFLTAYFSRNFWMQMVGLDPNGGLTNVSVSQSSTELILYDFGSAIDGDRIQLSVNGDIVLEDHALTEKEYVVQLDLEHGANKVVVTALNEGSTSPNTVAISIANVSAGQSDQISNGLETNQKESFIITAP
jgi:hypothetical protein